MKVLLCVLFCLDLTSRSVSAATLYGLSSSSPGYLYTINPGGPVAVATLVTGISPGVTTGGVGLEAYGGLLYATNVGISANPYGSFGSINPNTGVFTPIFNQDINTAWLDGLAVNPSTGTFYSVHQRPNDGFSELLSFTTSGTVSVVGNVPNHVRGLAFNSDDGLLYGVSNNAVYTIDPLTATMTLVGLNTAQGVTAGLAYDPATKLLYMSTEFGFYNVSPINGSAALAGYGSPSPLTIQGLALLQDASDVPEPSMFLAVGLSIVSISLWRRRESINRTRGE